MAGTRFAAKVGEVLDLEMRFTINDVLTDVVDVTAALFTPLLVRVETVTPTRISTGVYRARFAAVSAGGEYHDYWSYRLMEGGAIRLATQHVTIADIVGDINETSPTDEQDADVCRVTHTFSTLRRTPLAGVQVTFQPLGGQSLEGITAIGECTEFSDEAGDLQMDLLRGAVGWLSVPLLDGMCRQVTIPDEDTIDLFDLLGTVDDHLTLTQRARDSTLLPRRTSG